MIKLDGGRAFVLKRTPYRENHYLVDLFTQQHGYLRATARIQKQKTHRNTENYAPFQELALQGRWKTELGQLWDSDILSRYRPTREQLLYGSYLNELMLSFCRENDDSFTLYQHYKNSLADLSKESLRKMEWYFIQDLGILPPRQGLASSYLISHHDLLTTLTPATIQGYDKALIEALENQTLPLDHPQLRSFLQTLLKLYIPGKAHTHATASSLSRLMIR